MAGQAYTLTVRAGSKVKRSRFETLDAALAALEAQLVEMEGSRLRDTVDLRFREFAPVAQVAVRAEIAAPGRRFGSAHGGIDLRGDGSAEAYTGRVRRRVVERRERESAYEALRRAFEETA